VHITIAATSTAAMMLAHARAGLTVVPAGDEAHALAPLPLETLDRLAAEPAAPALAAPRLRRGKPLAPTAPLAPVAPIAPELRRWGLRTLGDLAALPSADLSARLGQNGLRWQRWARGEDARPLVPAGVADPFEQSLDLEWPIEGLEPLSFVLARLLEPLCDRLEREDRGGVVLRLTLTLVTRATYERSIELPAPIRDARVLRTLALLDLESNPPPAAIDRVTVGVDVTEGRVLQFELFARALPTETRVTLLARLGALMGRDRVGAPSLVDTHRPGAFAMATFAPPLTPNPQPLIPNSRRCAPDSAARRHGSPDPSVEAARPVSVVRRFRSPIPARVTLERGAPVRVITDRRGFSGGRVERCEGPWRSSGDWWTRGWNCDEWEVTLSDGGVYRLSQGGQIGRLADWQIEGLVD
jgi:protein ImuB